MTINSNDLVNYTHLVGQFYDQFPYPEVPIKAGLPSILDWRFSLENIYSECTGAISPLQKKSRTIRILDAGCGTGVSTNSLSYFNSGAEIVAIDISKKSLAIAKKRLSKSSAYKNSKIIFKEIDLLKYYSEKGFDYINSIGLLNHIKDPLEGFHSLERNLHEDGIIHLFIYSDYGRYQIKLMNQIFKILDLNATSNGITLARKLIDDLPYDNPLKNSFQAICSREYISDFKFADIYLHPFETNFTLNDLFNLLDLSGLKLLGFSNKKVWNIERLLNGKLLEKANLLSPKDKLQLIEKLDPNIDGFDIFLAKKIFKIYEWSSDKELLLTKAKVNACFVDLERNIFLDQDMKKTHLTSQEINLLTHVRNNPGKPLQLLGQVLASDGFPALIRGLWQKKMLLLYPL